MLVWSADSWATPAQVWIGYTIRDTTHSDTVCLLSGAQVDVFFGTGVGPIYLSDVQCTGMETNILNCSHGNQLGITTCDHAQDASIRCEGKREGVRVLGKVKIYSDHLY